MTLRGWTGRGAALLLTLTLAPATGIAEGADAAPAADSTKDAKVGEKVVPKPLEGAAQADAEAGEMGMKADPEAGAMPAKEEANAPAKPAPEKPKKAKKKAKAAGLKAAAIEPEVSADALAGRPAKVVSAPEIDAAKIDAMLEAALADSKVKPAEPTSDVEFIRRAYLDLVGHPPTPAQVGAFNRDKSPKKRDNLVVELLADKRFGDNWGRYWRDVIKSRAPQANAGRVRYDVLERWLAERINADAPWDEIAAGMITANGRVDEVGATTFITAESNDPVELAGEVSRIFMGVQIQCAQCHDHLTDPWKREQFHEFAAFFAGTRNRRLTKPNERPVVFEVFTQPGVPRYTMPKQDDPTKLIPIKPKFFLASSEQPLPANLKAQDRRVLAASYVTGQDNPWFAKAYVNRVWAALMGEPFVSPIDDLGPSRDVVAGELFDRLSSEWQRGGYDTKWLFRTLMQTKAYQRRVKSTASAAGRTTFAANGSSRLRSDQIYDSLAQVLGLNAANGKDAKADLKGAGKDARAARRSGDPARVLFNGVFTVDPSTPTDEVVGTIPQALTLMNGPQVNRAIAYRKGATTKKGDQLPGSVLAEILDNAPEPKVALDRLYLRVLSRRPTPEETKVFEAYTAQPGVRPREAFEDLFWALINSTEFLSRR